MSEPEAIVVLLTTATRDEAERLAELLLAARLAACVQITGPVTSVYRWQGNIETSQEWLCTIKTRDNLFPQVEAAIRSLHSYQVPEILATPIIAGHEPYLKWLDEQLLK